MTDPKTVRLIIWLFVGVVAFVVIRRIGIAALFGKKGGPEPTIFGGGGAGGGTTGPGVSDTPTGATTHGIDPGTGNPVTIGGTNFYNIPGTQYIGRPGSKASDIVITDRKTDTSAGASVVSANIPGSTFTQGATPKDVATFSAFHAQDSAVVAQQSIERNNVAASQAGTGQFVGYRNDGTPLLIYRP